LIVEDLAIAPTLRNIINIAMLLSTQTLRSKRPGILYLRMNQETYTHSINLKYKLETLHAMKDDAKSIKNTQVGNGYHAKVKKIEESNRM
jgi:hypothetical protein